MSSLGSLFWAMLAFGLAFSGLMVFAGARRLLGAMREERPVEAVIWGGIGIAMGLTGVVVASVFAYRTLRT